MREFVSAIGLFATRPYRPIHSWPDAYDTIHLEASDASPLRQPIWLQLVIVAAALGPLLGSYREELPIRWCVYYVDRASNPCSR